MAHSSALQIDLMEAIAASTSLSGEHPAKTSASPDSAQALMETAATSLLSSRDWLLRYGLGGSCGKTSPEFCPTKADGLSLPSSGAFSSSGMASPGECWMLSSSEWPSDASVCSLSDILEAQPVPERYFLSPKACAGILRRAEKRGKKLPERLRIALEEVASRLTLKPSEL